MFGCLHGSGDLRALAFEFSPLVEQTAPDTVTFGVAGLARLFGAVQDIAAAILRRAAETGVKANLAMAANPDAAICAARGFKSVSIVPQGDEAKFLASLPLKLLGPSPELQETLARWGIRRFQDLASLPALGIAERLGREGLHLRERARGEVNRKLVTLEDPPRFEDGLELDYPVELIEPLAFVLSRLLSGLTTRLGTRGLATNELRLRLKLKDNSAHERTLRLPVPSLDQHAILKLLQLDLTAHPPSGPVMHVHLEASPVQPRAFQNGLYVPLAPEPVKLELTLARIRAFVGEERVGSPELLDTHRPDAFRMAGVSNAGPSMASVRARMSARLAIRIFRPPRAARVVIESGRPRFVAAHGIHGRVLEAAGPWRTSGDWWTVDPWERDEWDIALSNGALYRLYCAPLGWFVEGSYD